MTDVADNRVLPGAPAGYNRDDFAGALRHLESGAIEQPVTPGVRGIFRAHYPLLPNRKADVNDTPRAPIRLSMPDINDAYPEADPATRRRIYDQHAYDHQGLLYFIQNDREVPGAIREQARQWPYGRAPSSVVRGATPFAVLVGGTTTRACRALAAS